MKKNITLKLDAALLKKAQHLAIDEDRSVSEWVAGLIARAVNERTDLKKARAQALKDLQEGLRLGGRPLSRDEAHER